MIGAPQQARLLGLAAARRVGRIDPVAAFARFVEDARIPARCTARKSLTVTLWLMSMTPSTPSTEGRHVPLGPKAVKEGAELVAGGRGDPPQPASASPPRPVNPRIAPRREIIVLTSDCSPAVSLSRRGNRYRKNLITDSSRPRTRCRRDRGNRTAGRDRSRRGQRASGRRPRPWPRRRRDRRPRRRYG